MNRARMILPIAGLAALACAAYGADSGATSLLPADSASAFKLSATAGDYAKMSTEAVRGQAFSSAVRIEVTKKPQRSTDVQISAPIDGPAASGDVLLVSFWMRSATPAEATLDAGFRTAPGAAGAPGFPGAAAAGRGPGAPGAGAPPAAAAPGAAVPPGAAGAGGGRGAAAAPVAPGAAGRGRGFGAFGGQPALNAPALAGTRMEEDSISVRR